MNLLVAIKSCHRYAARRKAMLETWLPELQWADYLFLLGQPTNVVIPDALLCDVSDAFADIAPKIVAACEYALEQNTEAMFVCDDDTYARPDRLIAAYEHNYRGKFDYVGFLRTSGLDYNAGIPYAQGSAYWLSAYAMEQLVKSPHMRPGVIDDGAVGRALHGKVAFVHDDRYQPGPCPTMDTAPLPSNQFITAHKALPEVMAQLHMPWRKRAKNF
jgi:hypothetical protein